ncbi:MAG: polyhydroxyalkanoic acid system family protein [bacterium]|nr:polyhydroxyalkanoic acid system family protein [Myxococcales bacterium]MCB9550944.1 polyhydroxyalkanoic acid system family protein [Myxococcales bacterium]
MAKTINITRPHNTTAEAAQQKLKALAGEIKSRYGLDVEFSGGVALVKGRGVEGTAKTDDRNVAVDLKLGMPASLVAGKIEAGVLKAIQEQFA